jgi:drug/metabolite transporter (DMT)-like permease
MSMSQYNIKKAVFFGVSYGFLASIVTFLAKLAAPHTTDSMIVFFRFGVSVIYISIMLSMQSLRGKKIVFKTSRPGLHLLRAFAAFSGQFTIFYALGFIPLADANLLMMTSSLFIPILGAIFLAHKTSMKNWWAIIIGFIGVALILKPGVEMFNPASLIGLASGLFVAISLLGIHELGKTEAPYTIIFYYFMLSFIFSVIAVIFDWQTPDFKTLLILIGVGFVGALTQECSIRALINAPAKIVAPLMYSIIIFSGLMDWIFWGHIPDLLAIIGIILTCAGSIFATIYGKEKQKSVDADAMSEF